MRTAGAASFYLMGGPTACKIKVPSSKKTLNHGRLTLDAKNAYDRV